MANACMACGQWHGGGFISPVQRRVLRHAMQPIRTQEHAGNDPTTQLVPASGGSGTWSKPGEESGQPGGPGNASITAVSNWASTQGAPPAPQPRPSPHTDRLLNPEEYPSLAASAKAEANAAKHAKVPSQVGLATCQFESCASTEFGK